MVTKYGMSEKLGPISYGSENDEVFLGRDFSHTRSYSESIASEIDNEVNSIITGAYERTNKILSEHIDKLHMIADELLKNEKIDGETFKGLMSGEQNVDLAETHEDDIKQTD